MRAVVHIGMHKTGTSSIQSSFSAKPPPGISYLKSNGTNLNGWARLMFEGDAQVAQLAAMRTADADTILRKRAEVAQQTESALSACTEPQIILSAERFTYMDIQAVEKFRHWLAGRFDQVAIYAYVRDPMGFVRSSFQQRAKALAVLGDFSLDLPNYRMRFEKYETCFGPENVHYRLFRPAQLTGGDVVTDFADWIGSSYAKADILRENEGLSVEALSILATLRQYYRPAVDGLVKPVLLNALIAHLQKYQGTKWSLARAAQDRIRAKIEEDADWMDLRLGQNLDRADKTEEIEVNQPSDLLGLDLRQLSGLAELIKQGFAQPKTTINDVLRQLPDQPLSQKV